MKKLRIFDHPYKPHLLPEAAASSGVRYYILDTNIFNFALTGKGGEVIKRINGGLKKLGLAGYPGPTAFCMTPFQLIEFLGIVIPDIQTQPSFRKGERAIDVVERVIVDACNHYLEMEILQKGSLEKRAQERRSFIREEADVLFDICVLKPLRQSNITDQIAAVLAWDYASKCQYPKQISDDVIRFLVINLLMLGSPHMSRFRIAKRMWDLFYRTLLSNGGEISHDLKAANDAMHLKMNRDYLDCDLIHLACFGWGEDDVIAFTSDSPAVILPRIAAYKGIIASAIGMVSFEVKIKMPSLKNGAIICCEPNGEISHIFPVQRVPTIV